MTPDDPRHGTNAGYVQHILQKIAPCDPCREAHTIHKREARNRRYIQGVDKFRVDATGTRRRIRALIRMGWRYKDMDSWLGYRSANTHNLNRSDTLHVHLETAGAVKRMYDELSMRIGPSVRNRAVAERWGWASPLAWDDDTIDDPAARPVGVLTSAWDPAGYDDSRIERRIAGDRSVRLHKTESVEVVRRMLAAGHSQSAIRRLTGLKTERYMPQIRAERATTRSEQEAAA